MAAVVAAVEVVTLAVVLAVVAEVPGVLDVVSPDFESCDLTNQLKASCHHVLHHPDPSCKLHTFTPIIKSAPLPGCGRGDLCAPDLKTRMASCKQIAAQGRPKALRMQTLRRGNAHFPVLQVKDDFLQVRRLDQQER